MSDLAKQYFERELTVAEEDRLAAEMASSPEAAQSFIEGAEKAYLATGLPEPLDLIASKPPAEGGSGWAVWILLAFLLALLGGGLWLMQSSHFSTTDVSTQVKDPILSESSALPKLEPIESDQTAAIPISKSASPKQRYEGLGVVVRQAKPGPVVIRVLDDQDHAVRDMYRGNLPMGEKEFIWDRTTDDGREAVPGTYHIEVQTAGKSMKKTVRLAP